MEWHINDRQDANTQAMRMAIWGLVSCIRALPPDVREVGKAAGFVTTSAHADVLVGWRRGLDVLLGRRERGLVAQHAQVRLADFFHAIVVEVAGDSAGIGGAKVPEFAGHSAAIKAAEELSRLSPDGCAACPA
ncbi:hypothetical protein [Tropicimonas sediminicola]|uniref:hypothetical protein n=1 Tax=Tropicimonas sediminicola TaxID=1031541 RepID=UPI000B77B7B1|nr:hypothetical protein [Tropicimonas sediminicola]